MCRLRGYDFGCHTTSIEDRRCKPCGNFFHNCRSTQWDGARDISYCLQWPYESFDYTARKRLPQLYTAKVVQNPKFSRNSGSVAKFCRSHFTLQRCRIGPFCGKLMTLFRLLNNVDFVMWLIVFVQPISKFPFGFIVAKGLSLVSETHQSSCYLIVPSLRILHLFRFRHPTDRHQVWLNLIRRRFVSAHWSHI